MFLIKYPDSYGLFLTIFYKNTKRGTAISDIRKVE